MPEGTLGSSPPEIPEEIGTNPTPAPRRRRTSGSKQPIQYGHYPLKVYALNESQLSELGLLKGLSTICFTLAGGLFGFGVNLFINVELATPAPQVRTTWYVIAACALVASVALAGTGILFTCKGHTKLAAIKRDTIFDAE